MLKHCITILILFVNTLPILARTNAEIGIELYQVANKIKETNKYISDEMKDNIATFLIEANLLGFNEKKAKWKQLSSEWFYDSTSLNNLNLRYIGVYKSQDGKTMGIFDVNCEDENDVQERYFGYVNTTEVYFSAPPKKQKGHSKGFYKTFCK